MKLEKLFCQVIKLVLGHVWQTLRVASPSMELGPIIFLPFLSFFFFSFFLFIFFVFCHWSLWQPLEPFGKKFWNLHRPQILSNIHHIFYRWCLNQAWIYGFLIFKTVRPLQPIEIGGKADKREVRSYHSNCWMEEFGQLTLKLALSPWHNDIRFPWQLCSAGLLGPLIAACAYSYIYISTLTLCIY